LHSARPGQTVPAICGWHARCSAPPAVARIDRNGDLVDILVYVLWIGVLVMILQRA